MTNWDALLSVADTGNGVKGVTERLVATLPPADGRPSAIGYQNGRVVLATRNTPASLWIYEQDLVTRKQVVFPADGRHNQVYDLAWCSELGGWLVLFHNSVDQTTVSFVDPSTGVFRDIIYNYVSITYPVSICADQGRIVVSGTGTEGYYAYFSVFDLKGNQIYRHREPNYYGGAIVRSHNGRVTWMGLGNPTTHAMAVAGFDILDPENTYSIKISPLPSVRMWLFPGLLDGQWILPQSDAESAVVPVNSETLNMSRLWLDKPGFYPGAVHVQGNAAWVASSKFANGVSDNALTRLSFPELTSASVRVGLPDFPLGLVTGNGREKLFLASTGSGTNYLVSLSAPIIGKA